MAPQFDRALRDLLRAAGCTFVRQGTPLTPLNHRGYAIVGARCLREGQFPTGKRSNGFKFGTPSGSKCRVFRVKIMSP